MKLIRNRKGLLFMRKPLNFQWISWPLIIKIASYPNFLKYVRIIEADTVFISHNTTTSGLLSDKMMASKLSDFDLKPRMLM